jgi:hypothetical protein
MKSLAVIKAPVISLSALLSKTAAVLAFAQAGIDTRW